MASDREVKWKKYFAVGAVDTKIKSKGRVPIYDADKKTIDYLDNGHPIHVPKSNNYEPLYTISYQNNGRQRVGLVAQQYVGKPVAGRKGGATENLRIQAETLAKYGTKEHVDYNGAPVEMLTFSDHRALASSIHRSLKENTNVSEGIEEVFEKYLHTSSSYDSIQWTPEVADSEVNELGKYVGELIIGLLALKGNTSPFSRPFYVGKPKKFALPTDPSFAGVDSILIMDNDTIVPISSKYGVGAKASVFINLLPKVIEYVENTPRTGNPPVIIDFAHAADDVGITKQTLLAKRGSKEVLYEYGIRKLLNISSNTIKTPIDVYNDIFQSRGEMSKLSKQTLDVLNAVQSYRGVDPRIVNLLPLSLTAFFSRTVADMINNDRYSVDLMLKILAGKNFWQANLQIPDWTKGRIRYNLVNTGEAKIKVIGSKAAMNDITASQGLLNYELKLP